MRTLDAFLPGARRAAPYAAVLLSGGLLYAAAALIEEASGSGLALSVLVEEGGKLLLLLLFALAAHSRGRGLGMALSRGLAAIAVFAAVENLAFFAAFPGGDILARLLWAEPVHLVSGLAEAIAVSALALSWRGRRRAGLAAGLAADPGRAVRSAHPGRAAHETGLRRLGAREAAEIGCGLSLALGWHYALNLLAGGGTLGQGTLGQARAAAQGGAPLVLVAAANALALGALGYYFAQRVIIGGFLNGKE
jgi:hypothetical protein